MAVEVQEVQQQAAEPTPIGAGRRFSLRSYNHDMTQSVGRVALEKLGKDLDRHDRMMSDRGRLVDQFIRLLQDGVDMSSQAACTLGNQIIRIEKDLNILEAELTGEVPS
jgi:hypothetical protein